MGLIFEGGASRFFHKGTNGRWRDVLTEEDLARYESAAARLDPELRAWLEHDAAPTLPGVSHDKPANVRLRSTPR